VVKLSAGAVKRSFAVAPLVAAAFLPPGPPGLILAHRDGDRSNCAALNLMWARRTYSRPHAGHRRKLSAPQEAEIRELRGVLPASEIGKKFGVSARLIRDAWRRAGGAARPGTPA
jgi:hypothetical protein